MSKLLVSHAIRMFSNDLACEIGLNEAIFLQQLFYETEKRSHPCHQDFSKFRQTNYRDGHYWYYQTYDKWHQEHFGFISIITIKRTVLNLEKLGLIVSGNFNRDPRVREKWYRIDYEVLERLEAIILEKNLKKTNNALYQDDTMNSIKMTPSSIKENGIKKIKCTPKEILPSKKAIQRIEDLSLDRSKLEAIAAKKRIHNDWVQILIEEFQEHWTERKDKLSLKSEKGWYMAFGTWCMRTSSKCLYPVPGNTGQEDTVPDAEWKKQYSEQRSKELRENWEKQQLALKEYDYE